MTNCFAIIDLGSNSVRMSVKAIDDSGQWKTVASVRETVRLAAGMGSDNYLKEEAMLRVIEAVKGFNKIAKEHRCLSIAAIATAALRNAANKEIFLKRMKDEAGVLFDVISGEEEAYYSYLAVKNTIGIKDGLIFDTGGGSTEISLVKNGELVKSTSLPLGAVVLTEKLSHITQMQLYRYVSSHIGAISWLDECEGLSLYGIGGSARTLAMLHKKKLLKYNEISGMKIPYSEVAKVYQNVLSTPCEKRKDIKGMDVSRADIIFAGLTPSKVLMDMIGSGHMYICSEGVKEGVFFRLKDEIRSKHE